MVNRVSETSGENVAVVATVNKIARTIFPLKAHERVYQTGDVSRPALGCAHD